MRTYTAIMSRVYPLYKHNPLAEVQVLEMHDEVLIVHVQAFNREGAAERCKGLPWTLRCLFDGELHEILGFSKVVKL